MEASNSSEFDFHDPSALGEGYAADVLDATAAEQEINRDASAPSPSSASNAYAMLPGAAQSPGEPERLRPRPPNGPAPTVEEPDVEEEPLPYGGDVQAAMRAQDRDAIRKIFAARQAAELKSESPAPTTPPGEPSSLQEAELQMQSMQMQSMRSSEFSPIAGAHQGMGINATASSSEMVSTSHLRSAYGGSDPHSRLVSPDPDVSYGAPFPYAVEEIDGRTVGAHSMPAGGQHGLGLHYIRGRLLRIAPPSGEKFANESSVCQWNASRFWQELLLQLLVGLTGPLGWLCAACACGRRGAESRGFLPGRRAGRYTNVAFLVSLLLWLLTLPLLIATAQLINGSAPNYDIDTISGVAVPLFLLGLYYVVIAIKYAFISPKELAWRQTNRRNSSYLTDELFFSWLFKRSERGLQWELELADWRCGGGLDAASFEFLPEQPADEPRAAEELRNMQGSTAPEPDERANGLSKRNAHGRWAGPDAPAALQRPVGVPLRTVMQRVLRYGAAQRTGKAVALVTACVALAVGMVHTASSHLVRVRLADPADPTSTPAPPELVVSSLAIGGTMMTIHLGHLLSAVHELRRRQLVLDIFGHMLSLTGHRHPSSNVSGFPLLVQDSTHNVHTWLFALQLMHGKSTERSVSPIRHCPFFVSLDGGADLSKWGCCSFARYGAAVPPSNAGMGWSLHLRSAGPSVSNVAEAAFHGPRRATV
eukprot:COSAG02_NODE_7026_length_3222_cov_2.616394_1_plen_706_part_00